MQAIDTTLIRKLEDNPALSVKDGILYHKRKICVGHDSIVKNILLTKYHNTPTGDHAEIAKHIADCAPFIWKGIKSDVKLFVARCSACQ